MGAQDTDGVGIECQRDRYPGGVTGGVAGLADHALMAEVNAVKDTNGEIDRLFFGGEFSKCAEKFHRTMGGQPARSAGARRS